MVPRPAARRAASSAGTSTVTPPALLAALLAALLLVEGVSKSSDSSRSRSVAAEPPPVAGAVCSARPSSNIWAKAWRRMSISSALSGRKVSLVPSSRISTMSRRRCWAAAAFAPAEG
jgi:hypothetical protein